jgi:hypothetical protein
VADKGKKGAVRRRIMKNSTRGKFIFTNLEFKEFLLLPFLIL